MTRAAYHDVVSALAYTLAAAHADPAGADLQAPYNDLTAFILRQQGRLPDYLRGPILGATLGFDFLGLARNGRRNRALLRQVPGLLHRAAAGRAGRNGQQACRGR